MAAPVAILLVPVVAASGGCTLVGFAVGAGIDHHSPSRKTVAAREIHELKRGRSVSVLLADGRRLEGKFGGVRYQNADTYAGPYASARQSKPSGASLPSLGPGAHISGRKTGQELAVDLMGFDLQGVVARPLDKAARSYRFTDVATLRDAAGLTISGEQLQSLVTQGQVPLLSEILLEQPAQAAALQDVTGVEVRTQKRGKVIGALVGLAVDIVVFASIAAAAAAW